MNRAEFVERFGEDSVAVVENEDEEDKNRKDGSKLEARADLVGVLSALGVRRTKCANHYSSRHGRKVVGVSAHSARTAGWSLRPRWERILVPRGRTRNHGEQGRISAMCLRRPTNILVPYEW